MTNRKSRRAAAVVRTRGTSAAGAGTPFTYCTHPRSPEVTRAAGAIDTKWFQENPGRRFRVRRAIFGEYPAHEDLLRFIVAKRLGEGFGSFLRFVFYEPVGLPEGEAPERAAARIFKAELARVPELETALAALEGAPR